MGEMQSDVFSEAAPGQHDSHDSNVSEQSPESSESQDPEGPTPDAVAPEGASDADVLFADVPVALRGALVRRGFEGLSAVQEAVVAADARGHDLQISSQTGSGKTVALGIVLGEMLAEPFADDAAPVVGPEALVIVPTRELASQVCDELDWLFADLPRTRVSSVTGGTPMFRDRAILGRAPRVLVGTPGRLLDHVNSGALDLGSVRELVLDEADQMLDMGFREDLEAILDATGEGRRTHLVSATFPDAIQHLARRYQTDPVTIEGTRLGDANLDIKHVGYLVRGEDRYPALVNLLLLEDGAKTLIFVERRAETMELATRLEADGFQALPISGDLAQSQRERTLSAFKSGRATILVATDVAARGLDVPDVTLVVQTSPPIDPEIYTHRSGRTGRAGKQGRSVLFAPPQKRRRIERLLADASVELEWRQVPNAAEVREVVDARAQSELEQTVDVALAEGPEEKHLGFAKKLLSTREPEAVVAALLGRLEPSRLAKPSDVNVADTGRGAQSTPGGMRVSDVGKVRFFINYGANQGATPGRLLASVCRRGGVEGHAIGAIAIHPNASTFDVDASVAESFEIQVSRRDPRDPQTFIRRDRGPAPGAARGGRRRRGGYGFARRRGGRGFRRGGPR